MNRFPIRFLAATLALAAMPAGSVAGVPTQQSEVRPARGGALGTGDGRIHLIPSLSAPSVKNGGKITVSAVVKSQGPVAKVTADMGGVATLELKAKPVAGLGALPGGGFAAVYEAEWTATGLEEKIYDVAITATDAAGHAFTDRSLKFSDPAAGISTPGTSVSATGGMSLAGVTYGPGDGTIECSAIDTAHGYAYFGTRSSPGQVLKFALGSGGAAPVRVGSVVLNPGEDYLLSAVIDPARGYAYFATSGYPSRVVKVALGEGSAPPARVGAIVLDPGEDNTRSAVIDAASGYAYFGTGTSPGRVVKVALGAEASAPSRVGAITLNSTENDLTAAVIDETNGYAYFAAKAARAQIVKVALGAGAAPPFRVGAITLDYFDGPIQSAVIDKAHGYAYFGQQLSPGRVVKVGLGAGAAPPYRVGAAILRSSEVALFAGGIDTANGYAYFGAAHGDLVKVALGDGDTSPSRVCATTVTCGLSRLCSISIDPGAGYAYLDNSGCGDEVVKVALGDGPTTPSRVGGAPLETPDGAYLSAAVDPANGYAYFGTNPGQVVKVALGGPTAAPRRVATLTLDPGEGILRCAAMDAAAGYVYFGTFTNPGRVVKVALGAGDAAPTRVGAVTLQAGPPPPFGGYPYIPGEDALVSAVIDPANGYAYFGTSTAPGRVVKVSLGAGSAAPARVGAVTLADGEDDLRCAVADTAGGYGYFGTNTQPGRVVKIDLGAGAAAPTRAGAVTLDAGEDYLRCAAIDPPGGHAYFVATDIFTPTVVKVALGAGATPPTRVAATRVAGTLLGPGLGLPNAAAMDLAGGALVFVIPGQLMKLAPGAGAAAPDVTGVLTLDSGPGNTVCLALDDVMGYAYAAFDSAPERILAVSLRDWQRVKSTRMTMPEAGAVDDFRFYSHTAAGAVRLALYDDATTRNILWESPTTVNTVAEGFVTVPVAAGFPTTLNLTPGTYHLAWQASADSGVPSYVPGAAGTGFTLPYSPYGPFPPAIYTNTTGYATGENWTQFLTYTAATSPTTATVDVVHDFASGAGGGAPAGFATLTQLGAGSAAEYDATGTALVARLAAGPGIRLAGWFTLARAQQLPVSTVGPNRIARARFAVHAAGQSDPSDPNTIPNLRLRLASRFSVNSMLEILHHTAKDPGNTTLAAELRPSRDPARPSRYTVDLDPVDVPYYATDPTEGLMAGFEAYGTDADPGDNGDIVVSEITLGSYPRSFVPDDAGFVRVMSAGTGGGDFGPVGASTAAFNAQGLAVLDDPPALLGTVDLTSTGTVISTANVPADRIGIVGRDFPVGLDTSPERRVRVEPGRQYRVRFHLTSTQATSLNGQITMRARSAKFAYVHKLQVGGGSPTNNVAGQTIARQALPGPGGANPDNLGEVDINRGGWYNLVFRTPLDPDIRSDGPVGGGTGTTIGELMPTFMAEPGPGSTTPNSRRDIRVGLDLIDTLDSGAGAANEVGQVAVDAIEFRSYPAVEN